MEWDTGKILAAIILLLLVAIIAWFMTRAGRRRAAARYAEAERRGAATDVSARGGDAARLDAARTGSPAEADVVAANAAISRDARTADEYGPGSATGTRKTLGGAAAAVGVGGAALGAAVAATRGDAGATGETGEALERATGTPARADGAGRDGGFDASRDGHPLPERTDTTSDAVARRPSADGPDSLSADLPSAGTPEPAIAARGADRDGITTTLDEGRRFDPSIDGHPVPDGSGAAAAPTVQTAVGTAGAGAPAEIGGGPEPASVGAREVFGGDGPDVSGIVPQVGRDGSPDGVAAVDSSAAGGPPSADVEPSDADRVSGERFEPVDASRDAPAAEALTEARASRLGVSAEPAAPEIGTSSDGGAGIDAERDARDTAPGARAPDGPAAFSAPNVPLAETDGNLRSQGSGHEVADVAPGSPGGDGGGDGSTSTAAKVAAGVAGVAGVAAAATAAAVAAGRGDGSPDSADAGGDDRTESAGRRTDAPVAFSAPNVPLAETDGELRSQGGGEAVADAAPGMPGAPGAPEGSPPATAGDRPRFDPSIDGHPSPAGAPGAAETRVGSTGGGGAPIDALTEVDAGVRADDRPRFDPANDGHPNPPAERTGGGWASRADSDVSGTGAASAAAAGAAALAAAATGGATLVTTAPGAETTEGAGATGTASGDAGSWGSRAADGGARDAGTAGADGRGSAESRAGATGDTTGDGVGGVSAARIHPADGDGLQDMGETVPLVHKDTDADPAAPVPAADVAIRESGGAPPSSNTSAGAAVAAAGPTDDRPDAERANLPDPAVAGGLDGLRPPPSTGESMQRTLSGLPDAGPALEGDFAVSSGDGVADAREMIKILNLRESDARRLEISEDEYRAVREGRADAAPTGERLEALVSRLAGMMV